MTPTFAAASDSDGAGKALVVLAICALAFFSFIGWQWWLRALAARTARAADLRAAQAEQQANLMREKAIEWETFAQALQAEAAQPPGVLLRVDFTHIGWTRVTRGIAPDQAADLLSAKMPSLIDELRRGIDVEEFDAPRGAGATREQ